MDSVWLMRIELFVNKSVEENAGHYFELAKKARKKLKGAEKAVDIAKKRSEELGKEAPDPLRQKSKKLVRSEWFEKFRWFVSSDGFLVIGGRDATTNEIVIKKYTDKQDIVLHTQMAGAPFIVIKSEAKEIPDSTLEEAAVFAASTSRTWKSKMSSALVEFVKPEQVTKEANSGEHLGKGAFVIRGKTRSKVVALSYAVCIMDGINKHFEGKVMGGPLAAVQKHCKIFVEVIQGDDKVSDIAKKIKAKIGGDIDSILRVLPPGGCALKKER